MLKLEQITKTYTGNGINVQALKGVSITFRKSEFVSVLGPSGCGKTTLLNIIGGLDHATDGDLVIDGVSTKQYKDRDWDTYRNHRIGFVFQSYNLIPHQTILENVELALNISGVPKAERVRRAKEALDKVGLSDIYNKKPNQLSGGQCQRVAIARALVGDPDILLADEPTGALDTVTSKQIMDLVKEISKERLVIMVTHNPEIAEEYSTRIVKLLDGNIVDDSNPYDEGYEPEPEPAVAAEEGPVQDAAEPEAVEAEAEAEAEPEPVDGKKKKREGKKADRKSKLSFWSAFRLSAKNLLSKLKRTILVCIAGSIGIIGVATVLSVSTGVTRYIDNMQNEMLSGNPVTISRTALNLEGLSAMQSRDKVKEAAEYGFDYKEGKINVDYMIAFLAKQSDNISDIMVSNNITQDYVDYINDMDPAYAANIDFNYGVSLANNMYTDYYFTNLDGTPNTTGKRMSLTAAQEIYIALLGNTVFSEYTSMASMVKINYQQAPSDKDFILSQYDIVRGDHLATADNELMIVLSDDNMLTDLFLAQLGYYTQEEFLNIAYRVDDDDEEPKYDPALNKDSFDYDKIIGKTFTWYPNNVIYSENNSPMFEDERYKAYKAMMPFLYTQDEKDAWKTADGKIDLHISTILKPKANTSYGSMKSGIYYTSALSKTIREYEKAHPSPIVEKLKHTYDKNKKSLTGYSMTNGMLPPLFTYSYYYKGDPDELINFGLAGTSSMLDGFSGMLAEIMGDGSSIPGMGDDGAQDEGEPAPDDAEEEDVDPISKKFSDLFAKAALSSLSLRALGAVDTPQSISIYSTDFETKDKMLAYLDRWNESVDIKLSNGKVLPATKVDENGETVPYRDEIVYTDTLSIIMGLIGNMITAVTAALVAFTALSLVVSTVMIAIITYVSVIERVKEIGVIRSLGGRKRDVSRLFTAETFIIGLVSGVFGILITFFLTLIINAIVKSIVAIGSIATLTAPIIFIMIGVSILLTLISGLIPARLAAKKDPVVALRTE